MTMSPFNSSKCLYKSSNLMSLIVFFKLLLHFLRGFQNLRGCVLAIVYNFLPSLSLKRFLAFWRALLYFVLNLVNAFR